MSLPTEKMQGSLFDVPVLTAGLFDKKNRYRLFREKILPALYKMREQLCELYCEDNGRPAIEPVLAAPAGFGDTRSRQGFAAGTGFS